MVALGQSKLRGVFFNPTTGRRISTTGPQPSLRIQVVTEGPSTISTGIKQVQEDIKIIERREEIKTIAEERGRPFTRLEAQRFLGPRGIRRLREATIRDDLRKKKKELTIKKFIRQKKETAEEEVIKEVKIKEPSVISPLPKPTDPTERLLQDIQLKRRKLRTERIRGETPSVRRELELAGLTFGSGVIGTKVAITTIKKKLPTALVNLVRKPKSVVPLSKGLAKSFKQEAVQFGKLVKVSPTEAVALVRTEILFLKGTGKALKVTGKVVGTARARLSPKFVGVKNRAIHIPSEQIGKTIKIKLGGTVKQLGETLKRQVRLAGKKKLIVSAQADRLINIIRKRRIVRKPIPNEDLLGARTRQLLKRFDNGKIDRKGLLELDRRIKRETRGQGSLLERSFFADPRGRLRPSRLGVQQQEASLLDVLAGDITFRTGKPQVLIFEKAKIEKLPKALSNIESKLKRGKPLTRDEANKLLQFQLKKSGKFKPVGKLTREPEVTLAPGEIIKKEKTIAITIIDGKRVPIVRARVIKAKPDTARLLKKAREGKITQKEIKKLKQNLKKETGFKTRISSTRRLKPRVRIPVMLPRIKPRRRPPTRPRPRPRPTPRPRPRPRPRPTPTRRPKPRPRPRPRIGVPPRRPPVGVPRVPITPIPPKIPRVKRRKVKPKKPKEILGFDVFGRTRKKFIKLNLKPLSKTDALSRGAFAIDKSTATTYKIVPRGVVKRLGKISSSEKGHFSRTRKKYRGFRIVKGKRIQLKNKFIEKRGRPRIDTRGEKRGLRLARFIKQRGLANVPKSLMKRKKRRK